MSRFRDEENDVLLETKNSTQFITLNRPDQLNALNLSQIRKLTPNYRKHILAEPQTVKTFVLKGSIEKAFCAGGDIKGMNCDNSLTIQRSHQQKIHNSSKRSMNSTI
jgi:enoyl-CoA hydratase